MDLFGGVSVISGERSGTGRFIRWRASGGLLLSNIIFVTKKEYDNHINVMNVEAEYPIELIERIDRLLQHIKADNL